MRVGFVSSYPPIECGVATYTESLNKALRQLRAETFVLSHTGAQGDRVFQVIENPCSSFAARVFEYTMKQTPDVVHIQHEYGLYGSQSGIEIINLILRYRYAGIPVVTTLHTVNSDVSPQRRMVLRHILEESSAVIVHEDFQREALQEAFGSTASLYVVEHGVRELTPVPGAKEILGLSGKKIVLLAGYFRRSKGFHRMIRQFPRINSRDEDTVLLIASKLRSTEFDDYRKELFELIRTSPASDAIRILRGQFPQYTFDTIMSSADVVVLPYESGAQSGILSQCFALGRPVVVSGLPAFRAIIGRSGGGVICEREEDLPDVVLQILQDQGFRRQLQRNIRRYVAEQAGWSRIAEKHLGIYSSVLSDPTGRAKYVYVPEPLGNEISSTGILSGEERNEAAS